MLAAPEEAAAHLSRVCIQVFQGNTKHRSLARLIDVAAYGRQIEEIGENMWPELERLVTEQAAG